MSSERVEKDQYDRGITPAETSARKEREGEGYKNTPDPESDLDTTGGYTVDREGLLNNSRLSLKCITRFQAIALKSKKLKKRPASRNCKTLTITMKAVC